MGDGILRVLSLRTGGKFLSAQLPFLQRFRQNRKKSVSPRATRGERTGNGSLRKKLVNSTNVSQERQRVASEGFGTCGRGGPGLPVTGGTGPLRVTRYIFNASRDKTDKKGFPVVRKVSSSLHFVNVSYNSGNCLRNSFNIHIGTKQLPQQMGPTTSSSAVPITLKDRCAVYENNL